MENGTVVCGAADDQYNIRIVPDGMGGAFVVWHDRRGGGSDIYMQGIDQAGVAHWTPDGIVVCDAAGDQGKPQIVSDGAGGAIIAWYDDRDTVNDIYAQRVDTTGVLATLLESFCASFAGDAIEIRWTLAETGEATEFFVFRDASVEPGRSYRYRVDVSDGDGRRILFETGLVGAPSVPCALYQNHPNPFNPRTVITYTIGNAGRIRLSIHDAAGRFVRVLADERRAAGTYREVWDGTDGSGRNVVSGVYFYRLDAQTFRDTKKMILLR